MLQVSDVLNFLQKAIQTKVEDTVPQTTPLLQVIKRNEGVEVMPNNSFYVTEWVGNFSNVGQWAANSQLEGGKADNVQFLISAKRLYADVLVDEFTVESMKNRTRGSLIDFVTGYASRMELAIGREMNRTFYGDTTGKIARADGAAAGSSSTSLTVQPLDADTSDIHALQYIEVGDYIKIGSGNGVQVTAVSGLVLTLASVRNWSDEDTIIKVSKDGVAAAEMQGLKSLIVNTGTIQNVNIANYRNLQAYVDASSHSIASRGEQDMVLAYLRTASHRFSAELAGFTNVTIFNAWAKILTSFKRTADTKENIQGGINLQGDIKNMPYLNFMGGKVYQDIDCWTGYWYNLDPATLTIGDLGGGVQFAQSPDGGTKWSRVTGYTPQYEATLRFYGELLCKNPAANAKLSALTV
jgi:hypothetical protein